MTAPIHASCVAAWTPRGWRGLLIRGRSGSGKSDLALRLSSRPGWRLVADDYCHVWASGEAVFARAPRRIAGLIEARGLGLVRQRTLELARIVLVLDCVKGPAERWPEPRTTTLAGIDLPCLDIDPLPASATELAGAAMATLCS